MIHNLMCDRSEDNSTAVMSGLMGLAVGIGYLMWRASRWQPMDSIIMDQMDRAQQREFVCAMVQVCLDADLNPENLDSIVRAAENTDLLDTGGRMSLAMAQFFHSHLKMQA